MIFFCTPPVALWPPKLHFDLYKTHFGGFTLCSHTKHNILHVHVSLTSHSLFFVESLLCTLGVHLLAFCCSEGWTVGLSACDWVAVISMFIVNLALWVTYIEQQFNRLSTNVSGWRSLWCRLQISIQNRGLPWDTIAWPLKNPPKLCILHKR